MKKITYALFGLLVVLSTTSDAAPNLPTKPDYNWKDLNDSRWVKIELRPVDDIYIIPRDFLEEHGLFVVVHYSVDEIEFITIGIQDWRGGIPESEWKVIYNNPYIKSMSAFDLTFRPSDRSIYEKYEGD